MAFSYNKKNLANTTITGAITSSDTSITVDDATVFPSGYFYATLMPSSEMSTFSNSEIVLVTNISSNTLTIARAQKNTTAKAFSAGAIITNGVYTEDLDFAQSVGKKIFNATWGGQSSPYYKITDDMLKVVPDEGTSIRAIFDTDYTGGTASLSINESTSGVATVSGSNISITDAENLAPVDVKLKGDTYQLTTTGKNKFNMNIEKQPCQTWTYKGINVTMNPDQSISLSGTTSAANVDIVIMGAWGQQAPEFTIPAGTYTTSFEFSGNLDQIERYIFCVNNETIVRDFSSLYAGDNIKTATIEAPQPVSYVMFRIAKAGQQVNGSLKIQIEQGSTATSFEPYTGGVASPNPDYPQAIQTVTGEQTITISDGGSDSEEFKINLGKNLWVDSTTLGQGGWSFLNGDWFDDAKYVCSGYVSVQPNTTYTLSASKGVTGEGTGGCGVIYYNGSTYLGYTIRPTGGSFTTPSNCNRIKYDFYKQDGLTVSEVTNIQLEEGSTATTYAPYFTPIELCKLGTYQDYIYKDNGNWYIHKETASYTFTGNENCGVWNGGVQFRVGDNTDPQSSLYNEDIVPIYRPQLNSKNPIYSDKAVAGTEENTWFGYARTVAYASRENTDYGAILFSFSATVADTREEFLNILAGTRVVYIRDTATDTQITDATLISQLNALANATLYAGTNNIVVTGGLDGILEVQYYRAGSGVNLVPIVNGAYVADDNTRNVAPVKAGIPYDLTYHSGNWYVMNMVKKVTADDVDFTTYTTTEQVVGTWIDGKTIYRKVITARLELASGVTTIPHNISGVSEIIGIDVMYQLGWDTSSYGDESYLAMNGFQVLAGIQNISIINVGQNSWGGNFKFVLRYTKNTDQQTRSVPDSETDNDESQEEPEEPVEEPQEK